MRIKEIGDQLSVNAIAGSYIVLLGINLPETICQDFLSE